MKILLGFLIIALAASFELSTDRGSLTPYNPFWSKTLSIYSSLSFCNSSCLNDWSCADAAQVPKLLNVTVMYKPMTDANGFIGYSPANDTIVISFRASDSLINWMENINFERTGYIHCLHCEIHAGWYTAYEAIAPELHARVADLLRLYPSAKLVTTGHALGGALAMIAGLQIRRIYGVITQIHTFGGPRIGNLFLSNHIQNKIPDIFRVVHFKDVIPHMPTDVPYMNGYHHPAHEIFWNSDFTSYKVCDGNGQDNNCSNQYFPTFSVSDASDYFGKIDTPRC